ncbi:N-acetyltransferase, partial [bacterium]
VGTVSLVPAKQPNQAHRADVAKLQVHPVARKKGIARALMTTLEERARKDGKTLLCLDTNTGDAAEPLYQSMGYTLLGIVPEYSVPTTGGAPMRASFYYKVLRDRQ